MQRNKIPFTEAENEILQNKSFLPQKQRALENIISLMSAVREGLDEVWEQTGRDWAIPCQPDSVKISRGENYRQLPYVILDYPRKFARDDVFAFRSMFWWGHFFSFTLHLQGQSLDTHRPRLRERLPYVQKDWPDVHLCVGSTPWQYHYSPNNYQLLKHLSPAFIQDLVQHHPFIKLSGWLAASAPQAAIIETAQHHFQQFMDLLYNSD